MIIKAIIPAFNTSYRALISIHLYINIVENKLMTNCPQNKTKIDHISIEFKTEEQADFDYKKLVIIDYLKTVGIRLSNATPRYMNKFDSGFLLYSSFPEFEKKPKGSIKYFKNKIIKLELSGSQCTIIELHKSGFYRLFELSNKLVGVIRRLDICYDDFTGKYSVRRVEKDYSNKLYKPASGKTPLPDTKGKGANKTWYLGSFSSAKYLRVYPKYIEQKIAEHDSRYGKWFRHEVVLKNQGVIFIPNEAMLNPDEYFLGAYPKAHRKLIKNVQPRNCQREAANRVADSLFPKYRNMRKQYGRTASVLSKVLQDDELLFQGIKRGGIPERVKLPDIVDFDLVKISLTNLIRNDIEVRGSHNDL
ncbi:replication initiation factor domain-containing protein [Thalassotalea atypica]|uniref:replication initiation factor domain-containing protein n=1 Tax=Thalassotalea atypica TaxID=2054316 RepID=UPI002572EFE4|nr:replication initiation factor domain-containing protein [Thalassotalea atypica]